MPTSTIPKQDLIYIACLHCACLHVSPNGLSGLFLLVVAECLAKLLLPVRGHIMELGAGLGAHWVTRAITRRRLGDINGHSWWRRADSARVFWYEGVYRARARSVLADDIR